MTGYGSTSAKLILVGEHAVVFNIPAIAIPVDILKTEVFVSKIEGENTIDIDFHYGLLKDSGIKGEGMVSLVNYVHEYLNIPNKNIHLKIKSNIWPERGLGYSASISISIIKALFDYYKKPLTKELIVELATFAERIHHQNPSGIDVNVLVFNKPLWFVKGGKSQFLNLNTEGSLIIVNSGIRSQTKEAVANVALRLKNEKEYINNEFSEIEKIVYSANEQLKNNNITELGNLFNLNHQHLNNIGVSSDELNLIQKKLLNAGALGSKLTGGGIGGCVIALAKDFNHAKEIQSKLKEYSSYIYNFGELNES